MASETDLLRRLDDRRLDRLEARLDALEAKLDALERRIDLLFGGLGVLVVLANAGLALAIARILT